MLPAKPGPSKMRSCDEPRVVVLPSRNLRFSLVAVVFVAFLVSPVSHLKKDGEDVAMFCNITTQSRRGDKATPPSIAKRRSNPKALHPKHPPILFKEHL